MSRTECLVIEGIRKRMGAVQALDGVSLRVPRGTIHGIIGHNGSGKSTLVKVLSGVLHPDDGSYTLVDEGGASPPRRPRVATVFQDLGLADNLTVLENVLVNSFHSSRSGLLRMRRERARARAAMGALGLDVDLDVEARRLPEPERVMVCVARALIHAGLDFEHPHGLEGEQVDIDLLLLDEPTSSLPREELERFRDLVKELRATTGVTVLVVTHNPSDIPALCDDFTALKGGKVLCSQPAVGVNGAMLAELMAGKAIGSAERAGDDLRPADHRGDGGARTRVLEATDILTAGLSRPVSLVAEEGELLGITGLEGSGFREFIAAVMGVQRCSGRVAIQGREVAGGPTAVRRAGAVYIPADRARTSGVPVATAHENMTLGGMDAFCRRGVISPHAERSAVATMLRRLDVHPPDPKRVLAEMSGGQQQKVVVGRALLSGAKLLVFEEPTAAVDVGARDDILGHLREECRHGDAVILASTEYEWMYAVCDRIVVFSSGCIAGELLPGEMTEQAILQLAYGN